MYSVVSSKDASFVLFAMVDVFINHNIATVGDGFVGLIEEFVDQHALDVLFDGDFDGLFVIDAVLDCQQK